MSLKNNYNFGLRQIQTEFEKLLKYKLSLKIKKGMC